MSQANIKYRVAGHLPKGRLILPLLISLWTLSGCDRADQSPPAGTPAEVQLSDEEKKQLSQSTRAAWTTAEPAVDQALHNAYSLLESLSAFAEDPTEARLRQAQEDWLATLVAYQPLHLYNTMADYAPQAFPLMREVLYAIAARPIEPGYLDSVGVYAYSGLVHDISLPLTANNLREQHGRTHEQDVSLGLFALEFMLFGTKDGETREPSDYRARDQLTEAEREQGYSSPDELPENRRRQLLLTQAQLLVEDFHRLQILWQPQPPESFYRSFVSLPAQERQQLLLQAVQLELKRTQSQLPGRTPPIEESPSAPAEAQAPTIPLPVLDARMQYISELLKTLQADAALQQHVMLAKEALEGDSATASHAWEPLQTGIDMLTELLEPAREDTQR